MRNLKKAIKQGIPEPVKGVLRPLNKKRKKFNKAAKAIPYILDGKLRTSKAVYYCPCCNHRFTRFIDGRYYKRDTYFNPNRYANTEQKVKCPACNTIPRHRILALYFKKHLDVLKGKRILYFAQEHGIKLFLDRHNICATTADLFAPADLKLDIQDTKLPDNSWDWIICNHVLEHVDDYKKALRELHRIIAPGGTLIISFPILESLPSVIEEHDVPANETEEERRARRLKNYGQADHLRIFGADSAAILTAAGFKVSKINGDKCPQNILPITGPADYDVNYLFVCKKPESGEQ